MITIPIAASPSLCIEPKSGYFRATKEEENENTKTGNVDSWRIGVGIFHLTIYE